MKRLSGIFSGSKASFQILSDLHLDHEAQYLSFHVPVSSPYLILAGNIGRLIDYDLYLSFLIRRCRQYEKIFLVLGALEFHGLALMDGLQLARRLEKEPATKGKLEILYRTRAEIPEMGVTLLGCTLWSKIPGAAEQAVLKKMPEFDSANGIQDWSVANHNDEHVKDFRWLYDQVHDPKPAGTAGAALSTTNSQLVVVTAFAPDLREALDPWQIDAPWVSAFGTELLNGMDWNSVNLWICGSTGRTGEFKKNGVRVVSNQRGRMDEDVNGILDDTLSEKEKRGLFDVNRVVRV